MSGYTRQSAADIVPTAVVRAAPINNELNALRDAFETTGGHKHDGTAAEGHPVPVIGDDDLKNKVAVDTANNRVGVFVEVSTVSTEQVRVQDGAIVPVTDNDIDLGTSSLEFKDLYIDGTANIDALVADTADINGGTVDGAVIGSAAAQAITGTLITATTGFAGPISGAVTGNVTGNLTGNVTGDVTGNVTGNITATTGSSVLNNVTITGTLNMDSGTVGTITNLSTPTNLGDAATKGYVDTSIANLIDSSPGTLDTLNELAAALGDDPNFATTVTNEIATKLALAGGSMSGDIAMNGNKISGLVSPVLTLDAANKTYVDTRDALKLSLTGGTMSGAIAMGTNKITGMGDPTSAQDAATKNYIDVLYGSTVTAAASAAAAAVSEANALSSANSASSSASSASSSATNSLANRDAAAASATSASNSASTATTQAGIATTQATNAATSAAQASAVALGNEPVRHSVRPSLLLDFANTKTLDPRITYTRASAGTYYDGKTVAKAEENLLVRSQEFENSSWTKSNLTITANSETAPDGTTTAETYTATANNSELYQGYTAVAQTYTFSVFLKRKTGTGTVSILGDGGTYVAQTITSSWARYSVTQTPTAGAKVVSIRLGTSGDEVYVWGAQLEQRSTVTAYTATTTTPITNYVPVLLSAPANVARFEHNPVTGESLGLEIEEQRTNLVTYSDDFADASWSKPRSSIASNTVIAPNGTLTGDKHIVDTGSQASPNVAKTITATAQSYTYSIYAKAAEWTFIQVCFSAGSATGVFFNLANGTIGTVDSGYSGTITPVGNGWYRCAVTFTATAASFFAFSCPSTADNLRTVTGNGFSGIYIWGAQLEAGAFATSYIPTVVSQVTRSADSASMTGANFSSWYTTGQGTLYSEANTILPTSQGQNTVALFADNSNYIIGGQYVSTLSRAGYIYANNAEQASLTFAALSAGTFNKFAIAFQANNITGTVNAQTVVTDTNALIPNVTSLTIGNFSTSGNQNLNGCIKKIAYYGKRLTNAELQGLTTV